MSRYVLLAAPMILALPAFALQRIAVIPPATAIATSIAPTVPGKCPEFAKQQLN